MEQAPQITPEMYEELMAAQQGQQPEQQQQPDQQPQSQQAQQQPAQIQPEATPTQPQEPAPEEINEAKKVLGVDKMQQQIEQMMEQNVRAAVATKYPDIPYDVVEKEIEKIAAIDPNFAKSMKLTPDGLEMAYRSAMASITPKDKPDNLTDGESGGGQQESLDDAVVKGEADDVSLGDYILGIQ